MKFSMNQMDENEAKPSASVISPEAMTKAIEMFEMALNRVMSEQMPMSEESAQEDAADMQQGMGDEPEENYPDNSEDVMPSDDEMDKGMMHEEEEPMPEDESSSLTRGGPAPGFFRRYRR